MCIIPARGGSKRIPGKNTREFLGKPILQYSIEAAQKSELFERIVVSTDDDTTGHLAARLGAMNFARDPENATDEAVLFDAVTEVITHYAKRGEEYHEALCLYPCAPFVSAARIHEGYAKLKEGFHSVFPVVRGPHIERVMLIKDERVISRYPEYDTQNSNRWPDAYYHASQWFWLRTDMLFFNETMIPEHSWGLILPWWEAQDIDTEEDWAVAEVKYRLMERLQEKQEA